MKLSAVVVWFNPDEKCIKNLNSYRPYVECIYVVDNSDADNSSMLVGISNVVYIPNLENKGIAAALNTGCSAALKDGFDWCMTMDQDSSWEKDALEKYLALVKENSNDSMNVSFAPSARSPAFRSIYGDIRHFLSKTLKRRKKLLVPACEMLSCDRVITSGNVINLSVWEKVGKFYEPFFIDEVDHEFCYRLKENGFSIIKFPQVQMNHILGVPRKTFWPVVTFHRKKRLYYIHRNCSYLRTMHPWYFKQLAYRNMFFKRWLDLIFNMRLTDIFYFYRGGVDARKGHLGRYEDWHGKEKD